MAPKTALDVVREFEDLFMANRDDFTKVLPVVHEQIVIHEAASLPYGGEHRGHDGWLELARTFISTWEPTAPIRADFKQCADDEVVVRVELEVIARATGRPFTLKIAEFHRVEDGKIRETTIYYYDTAAMLAVLEPEGR